MSLRTGKPQALHNVKLLVKFLRQQSIVFISFVCQIFLSSCQYMSSISLYYKIFFQRENGEMQWWRGADHDGSLENNIVPHS